MSLAKRLQNLLKEKRMTEADLGEKVNISQQAINKIIQGETKRPRHLVTIAAALNVDPIWLMSGIDTTPTRVPSHIPRQDKEHKAVSSIPIYNSIIKSFSSGELFLDLQSKPSSYINLPSSSYTQHNLYGIYMIGESMKPRFNHGELIIADAKKPPQIGDHCIIHIQRKNEAYVKNLSHIENNIIIGQQYFPKKQVRFSFQEVTLHRIIQIEDLLK